MEQTGSGQQERVAHIVGVVSQATSEERLAGMAWYASFGQAIADYGTAHGLTRQQSWAIFAALSPQCPIARNWSNFKSVCEHHNTQGCVMVTGHMRRKVAGSLDGSLPVADVVKGDKVGSFYANLSGDMGRVTIDRHAIAVAEGQAPIDTCISRKAYSSYQEAYRAASLLLGMSPAQVQAVSWVVWRRLKGMNDMGGLELSCLNSAQARTYGGL